MRDLFPLNPEAYAGKLIKCGLFQSTDIRLINTDINGAENIITKAFSKAIEGIEGDVVHPVRGLLS